MRENLKTARRDQESSVASLLITTRLATNQGMSPYGQGPHFAVRSRALKTWTPRLTLQAIDLTWPELVYGLEKQCQDRFEKLANWLIQRRQTRLLSNQQASELLLLTSCHRSEGRTSLAMLLGRALSRYSDRVLIVDADLSSAGLTKGLGLKGLRWGLDDAVFGHCLAEEALHWAPNDHLAILPIRAVGTSGSGFWSHFHWLYVSNRLRQCFDHVLLDGCPLLGPRHSSIPSQGVDQAIVVCRQDYGWRSDLPNARRELQKLGVPLLGLAHTFVQEDRNPQQEQQGCARDYSTKL